MLIAIWLMLVAMSIQADGHMCLKFEDKKRYGILLVWFRIALLASIISVLMYWEPS